MSRIIFALMALGLCSCAVQTEAQRQAEIARNVAADDARCRSYGAVPGTDTYAQCRTAIVMESVAAVNREAAQQTAFSNSMMAAGATILSNQQAQQSALAASAPTLPPLQMPIRCRSTSAGYGVNTTCQ